MGHSNKKTTKSMNGKNGRHIRRNQGNTGRNISTKEKDTETTEPKWATQMEKWGGTDKEKEEIAQAYKKKERPTKKD